MWGWGCVFPKYRDSACCRAMVLSPLFCHTI